MSFFPLAPCDAQIPGVDSWAYQLQEADLAAIAADTTFHLIVMDYSSDGTGSGEYSYPEIEGIRESGVVYCIVGFEERG
ncbi:hypothetical protein JXA88_18355 [Candidatus Fermentibacteria bacterium]|nr:hypothetical protein [Candidatus Fermentibacteria bacterium]